MRAILVGCAAAVLAAAQGANLTVTTGLVTTAIDERIYGVALDPQLIRELWGEAVRNRSFEEALSSGAWRVNRGVLECTGGDGRFRFGDDTWRDYEIAVDAVRPGADGALLIGNTSYTIVLGAGRFDLVRGDAVLQSAPGAIEKGRAYRLRLRVEPRRLQFWLDGRRLFDLAEDTAGGPFVGTRGGPGRFANLKASSLDGAALLPGVPTAARDWYATGALETELSRDPALNGDLCTRVVVGDGEGGIEQHGIAARAGDTLRGSLWMRGQVQGVTIRLVDGSHVLASQQIAPPGDRWGEVAIALTPAASAPAAILQILARGPAAAFIDQVSLMPDSARATGGFRPDLLQALAALHPPILRWEPGNWKDAIGPQAKRSAAFGIDEAVALARKLGAQLVPVAGADARELLDYCRACGLRYIEVPPGTAGIKQANPAIKIVAAAKGPGVDYVLANAWNVQDHGLRAAAALNAMERRATVRMATAVGLIHFDPAGWSPTPDYAVLKIYREHYASDVLQLSGEAGGLEAIATGTADGGRICLKLVNSRNDAAPVEVALRGDFPLAAAAMQVMSADGRIESAPVERAGLSVKFRIPPQSVAVVTLLR